MDFVDNVIERAPAARSAAARCSPIRRRVHARHVRARARAGLAALRGAAACPTSRSAPSRCANSCWWSDADNTARRNTSRSASSSATCASSRTGLRPTTASIVNGLMRAARHQGHAAGAGRAAAPPAARKPKQLERGAMKISHFFIDRPIFASVLVDRVHHSRRRRRSSRLPVAQYPEIAPPIINVIGPVSGRQRRDRRRQPWSRRSSSRSTASRTCSTCPRTRPPTGASPSR